MCDLDRQARLLSNGDRFAHRHQRAIGFIADVRDIKPP
jgi:hypothetical protein